MHYRRTALITAGAAAALLLLRIAMAHRAATWAAEHRVLSLPERLLVALGEGAYVLVVPLLLVAVTALWRSRRSRAAA